MSDTCPAHNGLIEDLAEIRKSNAEMMKVQLQMSVTLESVAHALAKLEDTAVHLAEIRTKQNEFESRFEADKQEHANIFKRLKDLEEIGSSPRLTSLENRDEKMIWGMVGVVLVAIIVTVIRAIWK